MVTDEHLRHAVLVLRTLRVCRAALRTAGHLPEVQVALVASSLAGDPGRTLTEAELEVLDKAAGILDMDPAELPDPPGPGPELLERPAGPSAASAPPPATYSGATD